MGRLRHPTLRSRCLLPAAVLVGLALLATAAEDAEEEEAKPAPEFPDEGDDEAPTHTESALKDIGLVNEKVSQFRKQGGGKHMFQKKAEPVKTQAVNEQGLLASGTWDEIWQSNMQDLSEHTDAGHVIAGIIGLVILLYGRSIPQLLALTSSVTVGLWASMMVLDNQATKKPVMGVNVASFGLAGPLAFGTIGAVVAGIVVCVTRKAALAILTAAITMVLVVSVLRLTNIPPAATWGIAGGKLPVYGVVASVVFVASFVFWHFMLKKHYSTIISLASAHLGVSLVLSACSHFFQRWGAMDTPFSLIDDLLHVYAEASNGKCVLWEDDTDAAASNSVGGCDCGTMCHVEILAWIIGSWCCFGLGQSYMRLNAHLAGKPYQTLPNEMGVDDVEPETVGCKAAPGHSRRGEADPQPAASVFAIEDDDYYANKPRNQPRPREAPRQAQVTDGSWDLIGLASLSAPVALGPSASAAEDAEIRALRAEVGRLKEAAQSAGEAAARAYTSVAHANAQGQSRNDEVNRLRAEVERMRNNNMQVPRGPPQAVVPLRGPPPPADSVASMNRGPPPQARGPTLQAMAKFDGRWTFRGPKYGKHVNTIEGDDIMWSDGVRAKLRKRPGMNSFVAEFKGECFRAELINDQLVWDDGDIWVRYQ